MTNQPDKHKFHYLINIVGVGRSVAKEEHETGRLISGSNHKVLCELTGAQKVPFLDDDATAL